MQSTQSSAAKCVVSDMKLILSYKNISMWLISKEKRPCWSWDNRAYLNGNECSFSHKTKQSQNPNQKPCFHQDYCRNPKCPFAHIEGGNFEQNLLWNQNGAQPMP